MWIVRLALRRPYTFVVMAMLIVLLGVFAILHMPTDIFPEVDIPVISVIWQYSGMSPAEMEGRIIRNYEGILTTTVNDIEHIESQSIYGEGVVRVYFQPGAKIAEAEAQVTAISQTSLEQMPPGIQPPLIMRYSASTVPILQLSLGSNTLPEQQLFDITNNFLRPDLATVQGAMLPWPYGGKQRQIMVDLEPDKLYSYGLSAVDISNAINNQNLIVPAGTVKIGTQEYPVFLNSSPSAVEDMNELPIRQCNGRRSTSAMWPTSATSTCRRPTWSTSMERRARWSRSTSSAAHRPWTSSSACCGAAGRTAARSRQQGAQDHAAVRPVGLRAGGGHGRGQGSGDRRRPDRADDPAVPGILAQHADHLHLDSAVDSGFDHHAVDARAKHST